MWAQVINIMLGIWLMVAPDLVGYGGAARVNDHIVGPLVATIAIIALSEVMRSLRFVNLALGVWLMIAPWVLSYPLMANINSLLVGVLLVVFSFVRRRIKHHYAGGWLALVKNL